MREKYYRGLKEVQKRNVESISRRFDNNNSRLIVDNTKERREEMTLEL